MLTDRYFELIGQCIDGDSDAADQESLAEFLAESEEARRDFGEQVLLDELLSQRENPERSQDAFVGGLETRIRAACDGARFTADMRRRIEPMAKPYPKRAASDTGDTPAIQAGEGGSTPTAALTV